MEEDLSSESLEDFGAIVMVALCFEDWVAALRLDVYFTISLRELATSFSFSPLSIQSGLGPNP